MTGAAAAWTGLGAGAGALAVAGVLLHRTLVPVLEIRRYAEDIAATGERIAGNTVVAGELGRLGALAAQIRALSPAGEGGP